MAKSSKIMRVSPEFFNFVKYTKQQQQDLLGVRISDIEITKMITKEVKGKKKRFTL